VAPKSPECAEQPAAASPTSPTNAGGIVSSWTVVHQKPVIPTPLLKPEKPKKTYRPAVGAGKLMCLH